MKFKIKFVGHFDVKTVYGKFRISIDAGFEMENRGQRLTTAWLTAILTDRRIHSILTTELTMFDVSIQRSKWRPTKLSYY